MRRLVAGGLVLAMGFGAVAVAMGLARDREYGRLVADGDEALAREDTFQAIEAFSGAIAIKKDSMLAYLKRGETYRRRGEMQAALRDLRRAVELDPTAPRPLEELGDLNYGLRRFERAAQHYGAYVRLDDRTPRVLYKLALARYSEGNCAPAIPSLRQAVELDDRFAEAYFLLGLCLRSEQSAAAALEPIRTAVQLAPGLLAAREELASLYGVLGRTAEEIEALEALAALNPDQPERLVTLGLAHAKVGRTDLAVLTLGRAIERRPEQPQAYVALARIWLDVAEQRGDRVALSKAFEALEASQGGAAATSETLTLQGRALLLAGDDELAERVFRQATTRFPVEPAAFLYFADVARRRGHADVARDALVSYDALVGDAGDPVRRVERAQRIADLSMGLDQPAVAAAWLARAANSAPRDVRLLERLIEARWRAGDRRGAREALHRALALEPAAPILLAWQRRLQ